MSVSRRVFIAMTLAPAVASCGSLFKSSPDNPLSRQPETTLVVINQNFLDFNIYLILGTQRIRIGNAGGNHTSKFVIPPQYVTAAATLQFLADPIGGRRTPVSYPIQVSPGDEVELTIPPYA